MRAPPSHTLAEDDEGSSEKAHKALTTLLLELDHAISQVSEPHKPGFRVRWLVTHSEKRQPGFRLLYFILYNKI